jgi:hypothetical protein
MFKQKRIALTGFLLVLATGVQSCMMGTQLMTSEARQADVQGTYTLLLYGCHYPADLKDVAILVADGGKYPLEIYDIGTSYKVNKEVAAQDALAEAESFVKCSTYGVRSIQLKRISDGSGGTLGFEVRPLYVPLEFGSDDVMSISYSLRDGIVRAYIRLDPQVERAIEASGSDDRHSNRR